MEFVFGGAVVGRALTKGGAAWINKLAEIFSTCFPNKPCIFHILRKETN